MSYTVLSLNPGIGTHLLGYEKCGGKVLLALEPREFERRNFERNLPFAVSEEDCRRIYNRKDKGTADLLQMLGGLKEGELDVLDVRSTISEFDSQTKPHNLFDVFGIARRLNPKIVLAVAPATILQTKNQQRFQRFLDFLRHNNLRNPEERRYFVSANLIDTARHGSAVSKQLTLIVGIRGDLAIENGILTDEGVRFALPAALPPVFFGKSIEGVTASDEERAFFATQANSDIRFAKVMRLLDRNPEKVTAFSPTLRQKVAIGFKKNAAVNIVRCSMDAPLPDPAKAQLIHPSENRLLSLREICSAFGIHSEWKSTGSDVEMLKLVSASTPVEAISHLAQELVLKVLSKKAEISDSFDNHQQKVRLAEGTRDKRSKVRSYLIDTDYGEELVRRGADLEGKEPVDDDYDYLFDANEIGEDFIVYGAWDDELGRRPIVGAVKRGVFEGPARDRCVAAINRVRDTSERRTTISTLPIPDEWIEDWQAKGRIYQLSEDRKKARIVPYKKAERLRAENPNITPEEVPTADWGRWGTVYLPVATYGFFKDKNTREIKLNKAWRDDPASMDDWLSLNKQAEIAYYRLAKKDFEKQERFVKSRIHPDNTIGGVYTTLSINRYDRKSMPAMGYHVDNGDPNSGLTTISVFDEGRYDGGYFVAPRYRVAFKVGDGDVFVSNSRELHGVTKLSGDGRRLSVVSYTQTNLGSKEMLDKSLPAKSPRPKFRISNYKIAIPSYNRDELLRDKTLRTLERHNIDPKRVFIFVANEDEKAKYQKTLSDSLYQNLVIAEKGIMQVRNFMWKHFKEGTPVCFMDDDIEDFLILNFENKLVPIKDLYSDVIYRGFHSMRENRAYLWSVYAVSNAGFMSGTIGSEAETDILERITVGNIFCMGGFYGAIIRHDPKLLVGNPDKEDHERSVAHFVKDGRVVRLDFLTVKTIYQTGAGGLAGTRDNSTSKKAVDYLVKKFPKYLGKYQRQSGNLKGQWEVRHL